MQETSIKNTNSKYPEVTSIGNDLKSLKSDIGDLAVHIKEDGLHDLQEKAGEGYKTLQAYEKNIEERVTNYPLQSLAIAFASGLAASYLFGRR
jgi:hypothetical protein